MKRIYILSAIFLSSIISTYSQSCINKKLLQVIESMIEKSDVTSSKKHRVISLLFYKIGHNEYFCVYITPFYNNHTFKGYCYFKDYIVIYEGIDDAIAKKTIDLDSLIRSTENIDSLKWNNTIFDPDNDPIYYKITSHTIVKFVPNKKHLKKFEKELMRVGYILTPPPPPSIK